MVKNKRLILVLIIVEILLGIIVAYFYVFPQQDGIASRKATVYSYVPSEQVTGDAVNINVKQGMDTPGTDAPEETAIAQPEPAEKTESATEAEPVITVSTLDQMLSEPGIVKIIQAEESSSYVQENYSNTAEQTCDGDLNTSWQEGESGPGLGSWIRYTFEEEQTINEIVFWLGVWREVEGKDYYHGNYRPREIQIDMAGKSWIASFEDVKNPQKVTFSVPVKANSIRFTIVSVYDALQYDETGIAEIAIY